ATPRNGQQAVLAVDILALLEALNIAQAILAGYDWGARTANIIAALWPERCQAMVSVSGSLDREPGHQQEAAAAQGRARVMVPMIFRHGTRPGRLRAIPARLCQAHWADRVAAVGLR